MSRGTILVVLDDREVVAQIRGTLEREGYRVAEASTGEAALAAARQGPPDLILLGWALPGQDGREMCRRFRRHETAARVPLILLTARPSEEDCVAGLEAGADDCLALPFRPRELVARVRAHLRRALRRSSSREVLRVGDLVLDGERYHVSWKGMPVPLTAGEFRILRLLAMRPGRVFSRAEIIEGARGGTADVLGRTVDVHVASIRRKLGPGGSLIETVRGVGYRVAEGPPRGRRPHPPG